MAKKTPSWQQVPATPAQMKTRLDQATREGRFQQALELARELYKANPTPANREQLHHAYLGRARQQRGQGQVREAAVTLQADHQVPGFLPQWEEAFVTEIGLCGDLRAILALAGTQTDAALKEKLHVYAADAAVQLKQAGRDQLPETLRPDCDRVLQAFAHLEKGQDDSVKGLLQGISLKSPFLEWKLLLRGLQAYYARDDERALDNWQRLNAERFPYRLIAPLRFGIDQAFRLAQQPATQTVLQRQADRLQPQALAQDLREVQTLLARDDRFTQALRKLEAMLPTLRAQMPQLVPKLADALYYMLIAGGHPDDVPRYQRVFGAPAHDPAFNRIKALGWERGGDFTAAHELWQKYDKEIADKPDLFPGAQAARARALIWEHMGANAKAIPDDKKVKQLPAFLRNHPSRPKPLKPGAEACFRRAVELAPEQLHAHKALFEFLAGNDDVVKALKAGADLLQRFPEDQATLERMAGLHGSLDEHGSALEFLHRAQRNNPLDRTLHKEIASSHNQAGRVCVEKNDFDAARTHFQAALRDYPSPDQIRCNWAACEFKAGNDARAEELLAEARQTMPATVVAFKLTVEAARMKLPAALKKRFETEWLEGLKEPDAAVAVGMTEIASALAVWGVTYTGQKAHQPKLKTYLGKVVKLPMTEEQLLSLIRHGYSLDAPRFHAQLVTKAQKAYPNNPDFWLLPALLQLEAGPGVADPWRVERLLMEAEPKAQALPPSPRRSELLEAIHDCQAKLTALNPLRSLFDAFDGFDDFFDDGF